MEFADVATVYADYLRASVNREVAPDDGMYRDGASFYFEVGQSALRCILGGLALSRVAAVGSILDLPCGHGRVARHLRAAFPAAAITVCDIDEPGVDFCARTFECQRLVSRHDPREVEFARAYDVIWVGSLFTHLDLETTTLWLRHLVAQLSPNGVLVATFHGRWSVEVHQRYAPMIEANAWQNIVTGWEARGYGHAPYPGELGTNSFGVSLSTPAKIVDLATQIAGTRLLAYMERGWADNHDVLVLARTDRLEAW